MQRSVSAILGRLPARLAGLAAVLATGLPGGAAVAQQAQEAPRTELVLLGTAGGPTWYGDDSPHGIASLLRVGDSAYLVDFGSGAYRQMREAGVKPGEEKALFFTHLHSDHVIDLPNLLMYDPSARRRAKASLEILGPGQRPVLPPVAGSVSEDVVVNPEDPSPGTKGMVDGIVAALADDMNIRLRHEGIPDLRGFFRASDIALPEGLAIDPNSGEWPEIEPFEVWRDGNVRVTATLVSHGLVFPNFAYRFDTDAGSVVFSGDTRVSRNLIRLARDADVLVHEAIDPAWVAEIVGPEPWDARQQALAHQLTATHVTPEQAGEVATAAGVSTLVLSHLVPGDTPRERWLDAARTFSGELIVGEDLMVIPVGAKQ